MDQESQNNTDVRGISSEERLWEKTIEPQHCQQKAQEDEDEDDIESTSGENNGPISYCQQIKKTLQHQRVEDETIVVARLSQVRQHSVKPYHKDNEDDEDEDVRPPRRRKRRRIDSDATETATQIHYSPSPDLHCSRFYIFSELTSRYGVNSRRGLPRISSSGLSQVREDRTRDDLQPRVQAARSSRFVQTISWRISSFTALRISCKEVTASSAKAEKEWAPRIYGARRQ